MSLAQLGVASAAFELARSKPRTDEEDSRIPAKQPTQFNSYGLLARIGAECIFLLVIKPRSWLVRENQFFVPVLCLADVIGVVGKLRFKAEDGSQDDADSSVLHGHAVREKANQCRNR
jgi:hypothetical protein